MLPHYNVRNFNAITINYFTCLILGTVITAESPVHKDTLAAPWFPYALFLSFMFILFFNINAFTIQKLGMVITSIFQKLSLVFPVLVGTVFFGESLSLASRIAIPLTLLAIILSNMPHQASGAALQVMKKYWYLPFLVIFGSGLIEISLFYIQEHGITGVQNMHFTTSLFGMAGIWGSLYLVVRKQLSFNRNEIISGIAIGIPNFFTIYLLLKGLELGWKGAVLFPVNNVGTIFFTALVGIFIFKEKMSGANYIGLILALTAVYLFSI